jgi:hypothetical protein
LADQVKVGQQVNTFHLLLAIQKLGVHVDFQELT